MLRCWLCHSHWRRGRRRTRHATYHVDRVDLPEPELPPLRSVDLPPPPPEHSPDVDEVRALRGLAAAWLEESDGRAEAAAVAGSALQAVAALGVSRGTRHGADVRARRSRSWRGRPRVAAATDAVAGWPGAGTSRGSARPLLLDVDIEHVGAHVDELDWYAWDRNEPATGWSLRLAVEDPANGYAWAVEAFDQASTGPSTRSR